MASPTGRWLAPWREPRLGEGRDRQCTLSEEDTQDSAAEMRGSAIHSSSLWVAGWAGDGAVSEAGSQMGRPRRALLGPTALPPLSLCLEGTVTATAVTSSAASRGTGPGGWRDLGLAVLNLGAKASTGGALDVSGREQSPDCGRRAGSPAREHMPMGLTPQAVLLGWTPSGPQSRVPMFYGAQGRGHCPSGHWSWWAALVSPSNRLQGCGADCGSSGDLVPRRAEASFQTHKGVRVPEITPRVLSTVGQQPRNRPGL